MLKRDLTDLKIWRQRKRRPWSLPSNQVEQSWDMRKKNLYPSSTAAVASDSLQQVYMPGCSSYKVIISFLAMLKVI